MYSAVDRIERLKKLLDDLQSRLNPGGVAVVRRHLDTWRDKVPARIRESGGPPPFENVSSGLRRQTIIWRQLLAGDKEPVAYLNGDARAALHGDVRKLVVERLPALDPSGGARLVRLHLLPAADPRLVPGRRGRARASPQPSWQSPARSA